MIALAPSRRSRGRHPRLSIIGIRRRYSSSVPVRADSRRRCFSLARASGSRRRDAYRASAAGVPRSRRTASGSISGRPSSSTRACSRRIFQLVGRDLRREVPMVRLDPQYRIAFGSGGHLDCTPDLPRLEAEIARLSPADAPNVRRFLTDNRTKLEAFRPCLERPFLGWRDLVSLANAQAAAATAAVAVARSRTGPLLLRSAQSGSRSRSSRSTSACRRSTARACSRSCRSSNTSTASGIRSAAAPR